MTDFKPGLYKHYRGGLYVALRLVRHHEGDGYMVLYVTLDGIEYFVRPLNGNTTDSHGWNDEVISGLDKVKRFVRQDIREGMLYPVT